MKNYLLIVVTFLAGMLIGYGLLPQKVVVERCEKDYQVACILSDICRCALDDPYLDAPGFEDLFWDWMINQDEVDPEAFKDYVYSY